MAGGFRHEPAAVSGFKDKDHTVVMLHLRYQAAVVYLIHEKLAQQILPVLKGVLSGLVEPPDAV